MSQAQKFNKLTPYTESMFTHYSFEKKSTAKKKLSPIQESKIALLNTKKMLEKVLGVKYSLVAPQLKVLESKLREWENMSAKSDTPDAGDLENRPHKIDNPPKAHLTHPLQRKKMRGEHSV